MRMLNWLRLVVVIAMLSFCADQLQAAVLTWSGAGTTGNWSSGANWGGVTPTYGDTLIFAAGKPRLTNTNDFVGLIVNSIRFTGAGGGYSIYGNSITLTNSIEATNTAGANTLFGDIVLATTNPTVRVGSGVSLFMNGNLSGSVGLIKIGTGLLEFSGSPANTYSGTTWVNTGSLILNRNGFNNALGGPLVISDGSGTALVQLAQALELYSYPITINQGGTLDLNGNNDDIGVSLTLNGNGSVTTGAGTLTLAPNATVNVNPGFLQSDLISGNLNVASSGTCTFNVAFSLGGLNLSAAVSGSATINVAGTGFVTMSASNSFTGQLNVGGASTLTINNAYALGAANGAVTISNTAALDFNGALFVNSKALTNASAATNGSLNLISQGVTGGWNGPVTLAGPVWMSVATNGLFYLEQKVSGPGGITVINPGALVLYGPGNAYSGLTTVSPGSTLYLWTSGYASQGSFLVGGTVWLLASYQLYVYADLNIQSTGTFHVQSYIANCNTLDGTGTLDLGTGTMGVGYTGAASQFDGLVIGAGDLAVNYGWLTLTANNTYTGTSHIFDGGLIVNGYQPQSRIDIQYDGELVGKGTVGDIFSTNGLVQPGNYVGALNSGSVTLTNNAMFFAYLFGSSPVTGYGQLDTAYATNVNISGANLFAQALFNPDDGPTNGQPYTIIINPTVYPIAGTFYNLPNGAILDAGPGAKFRVGYNEGNRNVVLTYTNPPSQQASAFLTGGNGNGYLDPNECNSIYVALHNPGTNTMTNLSAVLRPLTPGVAVTQPFSKFPNVPAGGTASNFTPFQVYTSPSVSCGGPVTLQASIATANQSTFSIPITVQAGTPLQFDNLTPLLVPDLTTVTSALPVSGLSGPITKVQVLMNLNHSYDNDLVVDLIAPDGTTVNLLSHNGQNGQNFGTICGSEATETVFDDYALVSVNDGAAPFLGNFRPISPLSVLNGKSGTNVNNAKWHLRVSDTDFGGSGILQCWSLRIWTGTCPDGGGICELCPNTTIYGMLGYGSSLNRLSRNGIPTTCANPTSCSGSFGTFEAYDAYTFHNGPSSACITVTLNAPNTDVFSAAYLSSFDPVNTCNNYLADSGDSTMGLTPPYGSRTYSFNVAANATFIVVANGIGGSTGAYSLSVTGGSCQPNLQINPAGANNVALKWTTSAGGYVLESTNKFGGTNKWQPVSTPPQVIGGKFVVTNSISGPNQYYRLHKP